MKSMKFDLHVIERIKGTLFGHFLDIGEMVVNNYQVDDLYGRYVGKYSCKLKGKVIWMIVEDVSKIFSLPYEGFLINLSRTDQASRSTDF